MIKNTKQQTFITTKILPYFGLTQANISPLGNGHINETFLINSTDTTFVLQRINTDVFQNPWDLVNNFAKINAHLLQKTANKEYHLQAIQPILTLNKELAIDLQQAGFWRAIKYVPNSCSIDLVNNAKDAELAANAFGHFSAALSDFNANQLIDVIPQFHHLHGRIIALKQAVNRDVKNRLSQCQSWVDFSLSQTDLFEELAELSPQLPLRICHNDTKINNMLFDQQDMTPLAIIDLDTCMKGHLMYDFGDMVRTCSSAEAEDSTNLHKVIAREEIIKALYQGYMNAIGDKLTDKEKQSLWLGAKIMPLMIGIRFLTDYLNGDVYFSINHDKHNLERASNQFTLFQSLVSQTNTLLPYFM